MQEQNYWMNRLGRRRLLRGAAVAGGGLAGAVLIGCGADDDDGDDGGGLDGGGGGTDGGGTPEGQGASTDGEPKYGGTLSMALGADPPNFDMQANSTYAVNNAISPLFNMAVQFDPLVEDEPPDAIIADLAESWEQSEDGLTMTFTTVTGAKYQNGQDFSSADIKAAIERIKDPPEGVVSPRRDGFRPVESIETPDDRTVVFHMSQPFPSLLPMLAQGWNSIYSAEDIANDVDFERELNGTGPFRFVDYQRGNRLEMVRNEEYHVEGRPYADAFTIFVIPDTSTELANFQSGELWIMRAPTPTEAQSLLDALGDQIVLDGPKRSYGFGTINFGSHEPWTDVRVRRAASMAHDREAAIALLNEGQGYHGGYMAPGGTWSLPEDQLFQTLGYEPQTEETLAEARALLDAAGVPEGFETTILTRQGASYEKLSLYIKDQLAKVGIVAEPQVLETAAAYDALNTRNFDLAPWSHAYAVDDPDAVFAEFYITDAPRGYSDISSPEVDDLFAQQTVELDIERRVELVNELEKTALELYGKIITTWSSAREARWAQVKDRVDHFSGYNNQKFQDVWLDV